MIGSGECTFIGSVIRLRGGGTARVFRVEGSKIHIVDIDGQDKECYYDQIEYICTP